MTQRLPLVATDSSLFVLASEIGWCASWVAPAKRTNVADASGDLQTVMGHGPPPPAPVGHGPPMAPPGLRVAAAALPAAAPVAQAAVAAPVAVAGGHSPEPAAPLIVTPPSRRSLSAAVSPPASPTASQVVSRDLFLYDI